MSYDPSVPEPLIDFLVPPRYPSRYRVRLLGINRREAHVRFPYQPRIFRVGGVRSCPSRMTLLWSFRGVEVTGALRPFGNGKGLLASFSFDHPLGIHEVAFFRRACGLSGVSSTIRRIEPSRLLPPPAETTRSVVLLTDLCEEDDVGPDIEPGWTIEPAWEAVGF